MSPSRRRRRASPEWAGRDVITVAALPGRGLYVRHLSHPEGVDGVHRPTVTPFGAAPRGRPASFDRRWIEEHVHEVDIVHVHGVPTQASADDVSQAIDAVRSAGRPLVVTAYHLDSEHLDRLLAAADTVITLTTAAAAEIDRRWSVNAGVLPHPHVVDFVRMRRERAGRSGPMLVGVHLGGLRLPGDPVAVVESLVRAAEQVPDTQVVVHVHDHLLDPDSIRYAGGVMRDIERLVSDAGGQVRAHRPMSDSRLWDHLFSLDASFVPPLPGSHSIWPEACFDLGTPVLMPADSFAAQQHDTPRYEVDAGGVPTVASVAAGLAALHEMRGPSAQPWRADPALRWAQRVQIGESLRTVYERLVPQLAGDRG